MWLERWGWDGDVERKHCEDLKTPTELCDHVRNTRCKRAVDVISSYGIRVSQQQARQE